MADINIGTTQLPAQTCRVNEGVGQNLLFNGNFESAPSFTAATTTQGRWIDGTAAGSTTNDTFRWAAISLPANGSAQFDTSTFNSGTTSMLVAKTSGSAAGLTVGQATGTNIATLVLTSQVLYGIPVIPSTTYLLSGYYKQTSKAGGTTVISYNTYDGVSTTRLATGNPVSISSTADVGWTFASGTFTTGSTAVFLIITIGVNSFTTGQVWFDDITVTPVSRLNGADIQTTPIITPGVQNISGPKIWS